MHHFDEKKFYLINLLEIFTDKIVIIISAQLTLILILYSSKTIQTILIFIKKNFYFIHHPYNKLQFQIKFNRIVFFCLQKMYKLYA